MFFALTSGRQEHDFALGIDQHVVLDGMALLLAAIEGLLDCGILGALDRPLRAILKVELDRIVSKVQVVGFPRRDGVQHGQGLVETAMQAMDPLIGDGLRHAEDLTKDVLGGRFAQIHQDEQQLVGHRGQGAVVDS